MSKPALLSTLLAVALLVGCGGTRTQTAEKIVLYIGRPAPASETKHIVVRYILRQGHVLVDGKGYALYAYVPEWPIYKCDRACNAVWPLFRLLPANTLDTALALSERLLKVEHDPEGGRVIRYAGLLLHHYSGDRLPGEANGEGLHAYGGNWYLISADGRPVK